MAEGQALPQLPLHTNGSPLTGKIVGLFVQPKFSSVHYPFVSEFLQCVFFQSESVRVVGPSFSVFLLFFWSLEETNHSFSPKLPSDSGWRGISWGEESPQVQHVDLESVPHMPQIFHSLVTSFLAHILKCLLSVKTH